MKVAFRILKSIPLFILLGLSMLILLSLFSLYLLVELISKAILAGKLRNKRIILILYKFNLLLTRTIKTQGRINDYLIRLIKL